MAFSFPTSPADGDIYTGDNGVEYTYNLTKDLWVGDFSSSMSGMLDSADVNSLISEQISGLTVTKINTYSEDAPLRTLFFSGDPRSLITVDYVPDSSAKALLCIFRSAPGVYPFVQDEDGDIITDEPFYLVEGGNISLSDRGWRGDTQFGPAYVIAASRFIPVQSVTGGSFVFRNPYTNVDYGLAGSFGGYLSITGVIDLTNPTQFPSSGKVPGGRRISVIKRDNTATIQCVLGRPMGTLTVIELKTHGES